MKIRAEITWSKNDNWETPEYIMKWIKETFENKEFFDPCPLSEKREVWMKKMRSENWEEWEEMEYEYILQFDWLTIDWKERNFVNPPYNITDKPKFVKKALSEYKKWNTSILLIPATTETQWFHECLVPYAQIFFIKWRVKFKWFNSKWEYVTNKTWQSWSILCVLDPNKKPLMTTLEVDHN